MIKVNGVSKSFSGKKAVDQLSFDIMKGEIFGMLGPNGAGKTTIFRMMTTLLNPDEGQILINEKPINRNINDIKQCIGMVSQHFSLQSEMTAREILELHGMLHSMPKAQRIKRIDELVRFADLWEDRNKLSKNLSGGMKRKLMIIRAIMHSPSILFLDEPTVGLDPVSRRQIWNLLNTLKRNNITIVLTTHYIEEAEKLCNRILLMDKGKKFLDGYPAEIIETVGKYTVEYFDGDCERYEFFSSHEAAVAYSNDIKTNFSIRQCNLEDVFLKYINKRVD